MKYCHEFIEIDCPVDDAMALFGDPLRLPEWAIEYCQTIAKTDAGYVAETVEGSRCFNTRVDRATGVVDACSGSNHDQLNDILHIRLVPAADNKTLASFIYSPPGQVPPEVLQLMQTGLNKEVQHAKAMLESAVLQ